MSNTFFPEGMKILRPPPSYGPGDIWHYR